VPLHIIAQHTPIPCSILNGSMSPRRRQEVLDEWKSGKTRILLASKRACGVGLNLPEASRAIFLDRDWNPQAEDQAKGRLDRRTQTAAELRFCHFVVPGTFDVVRFGVHESKREQMDLALGKRVDEDNFIAPIYEAISHFSEVYTEWCRITAGADADTASSSQQAMWNAEMNACELQRFGGEEGQAKAARKMAMLKLLQAEARRAEELGISVEELRIRRRHEENRVREEVRAKELARDEADAAKLNMGVRELKRKRKAALSERAKSKGITVHELIREEKRARMAAKPAASARAPLQPLVQPLPQAQ
jgi:superfamily II DNA/RNA helicase